MKAIANLFFTVLMYCCCSSYLLHAQEISMTILNAPSTVTQQCFYVNITTDVTVDQINVLGNGTQTNCGQSDNCPTTVCYDRPQNNATSKLIQCEAVQGSNIQQDGCTVIIWPNFAEGSPEMCYDLGLIAECGFQNPCDPCDPNNTVTHLTVGIFEEDGSFEYLGYSGQGTIDWYDGDGELVHAGAWVNYSTQIAYAQVKLYQEDGSTYNMDCGFAVDLGCNNARQMQQLQTTASLASTSLANNYPNPFSSTTAFSFSLEEKGPIRLSITDNTGRLVAVLLENNLTEAGKHDIRFDGSHLPTGLYYYTLETKKGIVTQKMYVNR